MKHCDLCVVMPAYNEEILIADVLQAWFDCLRRLKINFRFILLNDGSTDQTFEQLKQFNGHQELEVLHKKHAGHGPTILEGYRRAVAGAQWVFQCDSDNDLTPELFVKFWENRKNYDAVMAYRVNRIQNWSRRLLSTCCRWIVFVYGGKGIRDVNVPYRLIRSDILKHIIDLLPANVLVPNVIIAAALAKRQAAIKEYPAPCCQRQENQDWSAQWQLWGLALAGLFQVLSLLPQINSRIKSGLEGNP